MADFVQTMKDWRRMCDTYTTDDAAGCCKGCPMDGCGCGAIYENDNADPEVIERKVNQWAAEHPEPVYPTWEEWLVDNGVFESDDVRFHGDYRFYMNDRPMCNIPTEKIYSQIPAEIAQKLGLQPKEG